MAFATILLGWALATLGQTAEGLAQMCQGLDLYRSIGIELGRSWSLALLVETYVRGGQEQGKRAEARQRLAQSYGWFTEGFDTVDWQETRALLAELA